MIGYVTVGSNDLEKARDFYDESDAGHRRLADHGVRRQFHDVRDGHGQARLCGVQAARRQCGDRRQRQHGLDRLRQPGQGRCALCQGDGAGRHLRRPAGRSRRGRRPQPSTAPISATSTATSSPLSASARRSQPECRRPSCSTAAAERSRPIREIADKVAAALAKAGVDGRSRAGRGRRLRGALQGDRRARRRAADRRRRRRDDQRRRLGAGRHRDHARHPAAWERSTISRATSAFPPISTRRRS